MVDGLGRRVRASTQATGLPSSRATRSRATNPLPSYGFVARCSSHVMRSSGWVGKSPLNQPEHGGVLKFVKVAQRHETSGDAANTLPVRCDIGVSPRSRVQQAMPVVSTLILPGAHDLSCRRHEMNAARVKLGEPRSSAWGSS